MQKLEQLQSERDRKFDALEVWWDKVKEQADKDDKPISVEDQQQFDKRMGEVRKLDRKINDIVEDPNSPGWVPYHPQDGYPVDYRMTAPANTKVMFDQYGNRVQILSSEDRLLPNPKIPNLVGNFLVAQCKKQRGVRLNEYEEFALRISDDVSAGLVFVPDFQRGIIDLARDASVAIRAGVQTLPMRTENVRLLKADSDWTAQWLPETAKATASDLGVGAIELQSRTLRIHQLISEEAILDRLDAAVSIETLLRRSLGGALDKTVLIGGQDGDAVSPKGLEIIDDVNVQASVGTPTDYSDFSTAFYTVKEKNAPPDAPISAIMSARTAKTLDQLQDTTNQPLQAPESWRQMQKFTTEGIPNTRGAGSDESIAFVGPFSTAILGIRLDASVFVREAADQTFTREIIGALRADFAVPRPEFFVRLTGITA